MFHYLKFFFWYALFFIILQSCTKDENYADPESGLYWIVCEAKEVDESIYYVAPNGSNENNEAYGNDLDASVDEWWDGALWLDGGKNVIIRNNYFHDNLGPGIEISDEDFQNPTGYVLENNRSINNYYGIFIWNFGTNDWPDESIIKRSGNDFSENSIKDVWIIDWY